MNLTITIESKTESAPDLYTVAGEGYAVCTGATLEAALEALSAEMESAAVDQYRALNCVDCEKPNALCQCV